MEEWKFQVSFLGLSAQLKYSDTKKHYDANDTRKYCRTIEQ